MKISLVIVLKNEAKTLKQSIQSVLPLIDEIIIGIDDKSNDDTEDICYSWIGEELDLPSKIEKFTFKNNFADIRNKFIAKANGDYVLILDGHEYLDRSGLVFLQEFKRQGKCEYDIFDFIVEEKNFGIGHQFQQPRLFKPHVRYDNAIHNVILQMDSRKTMHQVKIWHDQPAERYAARKKQRKKINIEGLITKAAEGDARSMFYLGQTYYELQKWQDAIASYGAYLKISDFESEKYSARIHLAYCYSKLGQDDKKYETLLGCFNDDVQANEHLILLGDHFFDKENYHRAIYYYRLATAVKAPVRFLELEKSFYTYMPWLKLAKAYLKLNYVDGVMECVKQGKLLAPEQDVFDKIEAGVKRALAKHTKAQKGSIYICASNPHFIKEICAELSNEYSIRLEERFDPNHAQGFDIIFCEWADHNAKAVATFETTAKKILRIHSYEAYGDLINQIDLTAFDEIIFVAQHTFRYLSQRLNLKGKIKRRIISNGIDLSKFTIDENKKLNKNIAWAGRLCANKGAQMLLLIAEMMQPYDYKIHVAGMFQERDLEQLFLERKPENLILYTWQQNMNDFFRDKSFILSTSVRESTQITLLEGMACGCYPLIYNWIGADELYKKDWIWKNFDELFNKIAFSVEASMYKPIDFRNFVSKYFNKNDQINSFKELISETIKERRQNATKISSIEVS